MPTYRVYGIVQGAKFLGEVEADDPEGAKDKMSNEAYVTLCHQCAKEIDDPQIIELQAEEV